MYLHNKAEEGGIEKEVKKLTTKDDIFDIYWKYKSYNFCQ